MTLKARITCDGASHTIAYDTELRLVDHDLERELVFEVLRNGPSEGCLAVRQAWLSVTEKESCRDFLEAMLVEDEDIRGLWRRNLAGRIAFAPQIEAAIAEAGEPGERPRTPIAQLWQWQLDLLKLPRPFRLAFCRSLHPELSEADEVELRLELIGPERNAVVLPFRRRP